MRDRAFETFNRSIMKAPVGTTDGGGMQNVFPTPSARAGVTNPKP